MKFILFVILGYIAFQIIFRLIIPVITTTRRVKRNIKEMHERMQEHIKQQGNHSQRPVEKTSSATPDPDDYIEFEEIK
jgi:hypothetical protein